MNDSLMASALEIDIDQLVQENSLSQEDSKFIDFDVPEQLSKSQQSNMRQTLRQTINSDISNALVLQRLNRYMEENENTKKSAEALKYKSFYDKCKIPRQMSCFLFLFLPIFERPCWCNNIDYYDQCRKGVVQGSAQDIYIPTSNVSYLNIYAYGGIEITIVLFLLLNKYFKTKFKYAESIKAKSWILLVLGIFIILGQIFLMSTNNYYGINIVLFFRSPFFIAYNRTLRQTFVQYFGILRRGISVFYLMIFNIFLYAGFGTAFFGSENDIKIQQNDYIEMKSFDNIFKGFASSIYQLFILQTTVDSPDVYLPYYVNNRYSAIFFLSFQLINTILVFNMVLAIFYTSYKAEIQSKTLKIMEKNHEQFLKISEHYIQTLQQTKIRSASSSNRQQMLGSQINFLMEINVSSQSQLFRILDSTFFEVIMELICVLDFALLYINNVHELETIWVWINWTFNLILFIEELLIISLLKKSYFKQVLNIISLTIGALLVILLPIFHFERKKWLLRMIEVFMIYRITRIIKLLMRSKKFSFLIEAFFKFIPFFTDLSGVLLMLFYFFTALGQTFFGGIMNSSVEQLLADNDLDENYILNNYNDFVMGMITCWDLLIVNNWNYLNRSYIVVTGSQLCDIFFVSFNIVVVLLALNVTIAFLIDFLVNRWEQFNPQSNEDHDNIGHFLTTYSSKISRNNSQINQNREYELQPEQV